MKPTQEADTNEATRHNPTQIPDAAPRHIRLWEPPQAAPRADRATDDEPVRFEFRGKTYRLFKRSTKPCAPFNIRFEHKSERQHVWGKSLETDVKSEAVKRAKTYIAAVLDASILKRWDGVDKFKLRQTAPPASTVGQVFDLYPKLAMIGPASIKNALWALGRILKFSRGIEDRRAEAEVRALSLALINRRAVESYQAKMVDRYCAAAAKTAEAQKLARAAGLRNSKYIVLQARSIFNKKKSLVDKYEQAGLKIPECIAGTPTQPGFMTCEVLGKVAKGNYFAPPDLVVRSAFDEIGKLRDADPNVFKAFWLAAGAGLRRGEVRLCRWEYWTMRDGAVWIVGGIGKDNEVIEVPLQERAVAALEPLRKAAGPIIEGERSDQFARRLNFWMTQQGWRTEKKMHELRAYVGSLIYRKNPVAAMQFLRHKTLRLTEQKYVRYGALAQVPSVL